MADENEPQENLTLIEYMERLMPHHPDLLDIRDLMAAGYSHAPLHPLKGRDVDRALADILAEGPEDEPMSW